jgi:Spy/CpxP family protein refolding chaperone
MRNIKTVVAIGAVGLAAIATPAWTQHGAHGPGSHGAEGHRGAQACATEFDKVVGEGRGFGMAFAADQNGYPGPMHVLELGPRLALTPEQETALHAMMQSMFAESRPKSVALLEAERRLVRVFAGGRADEPTVRAAVAEVEHLRGELRLVHLLTHLRTRDLLTDEQRRMYHEARWAAR